MYMSMYGSQHADLNRNEYKDKKHKVEEGRKENVQIHWSLNSNKECWSREKNFTDV